MAIKAGDAVILREDAKPMHLNRPVMPSECDPVHFVVAVKGNKLLCHAPLTKATSTLDVWDVRLASDAERTAQKRLVTDEEYIFPYASRMNKRDSFTSLYGSMMHEALDNSISASTFAQELQQDRQKQGLQSMKTIRDQHMDTVEMLAAVIAKMHI